MQKQVHIHQRLPHPGAILPNDITSLNWRGAFTEVKRDHENNPADYSIRLLNNLEWQTVYFIRHGAGPNNFYSIQRANWERLKDSHRNGIALNSIKRYFATCGVYFVNPTVGESVVIDRYEFMSVAEATKLWLHDPQDDNVDFLRSAWEALPKATRRRELSKLAPWAKQSIETKLLANERFLDQIFLKNIDPSLREDQGLYTFVDFTKKA
jgi:hypothetical protein